MPNGVRDEFPTAVPESVGVPSSALRELTAQVQGYVDRDDIVGAELLIIKDRKTVLHETAGWRDREDHLGMEAGTIFNVRSMTKAVVGTATQMLIQAGVIGIRDKAAQYLDSFDNPGCREITIEHLLTHRSGLPTMSALGQSSSMSNLKEVSDFVGAAGPAREPGSAFEYTDAGYDALGAILEAVTGESLEDYVTRNVLAPLGMSDTFSVIEEGDGRLGRICSHYQRDEETGEWTRWRKPTVDGSLYRFMMGAQGLYGTLVDYARFLSFWMDQGRVGSHLMLRPDLIETAALRPVSVVDMAGQWPRRVRWHHSDGLAGAGPDGAYFPDPSRADTTDIRHLLVLDDMAVLSSVTGQATAFGHGGSPRFDGTIAMAWPELDLMALYFTHSRGQTTRMKLPAHLR